MVLRKRLYISGMREEVVDGGADDIMVACWLLYYFVFFVAYF